MDGLDEDPLTSAGDLVHFVHADHLGSASVITDANGEVVRRLQYGPWGSQRLNQAVTVSEGSDPSEGYTGQRYSSGTGLLYYGARFYDPEIGRFIQPYSMVPDPTSPQTLNRYTYVRNDPLNRTDPTGNFSIGGFFGGVGRAIGGAFSAIGNFFGAIGSAISGFFAKAQSFVTQAISFARSLVAQSLDAAWRASMALRNTLQAIRNTVQAKIVNPIQQWQVTHARMSDAVYGVSDSDIGSLSIDGYTLDSIHTDPSGMKAALFVNGDSSVLAFAGTSPSSWANWTANFRQAFGFKSAQYDAGIRLAASLEGNVHFTGHSLGGGIASASAIITGRGATVFNAAGVHSNTLRGYSPSNGSVTHFRSSFDVVQGANALTPASVPGRQVSMGAAGLHGMGSMCRAMGC